MTTFTTATSSHFSSGVVYISDLLTLEPYTTIDIGGFISTAKELGELLSLLKELHPEASI